MPEFKNLNKKFLFSKFKNFCNLDDSAKISLRSSLFTFLASNNSGRFPAAPFFYIGEIKVRFYFSTELLLEAIERFNFFDC